MNLSNLETVLSSEPKFRIKQAKDAIFKDLAEDWNSVFTFPKDLREKLNKECPLSINAKTLISNDGKTIKSLNTLSDGLEIETVLMRHEDGRNTVCVSSQVGCALGCKFCATGTMGFKRNLESSEIVEQVLFFARLLKKENKIVTNVVVMGMGEPFLNYDNVLSAIRILNDHTGFNLGARNFSISTSGIIEGINKLSEEPLQINLAISLHAPDSELRSKIMPVDRQYSLSDILLAVDNYIKKTNRKVMFEYLLLDGINGSEDCARLLVPLMKKPLYMVNLVTYNRFAITPHFSAGGEGKVRFQASTEINSKAVESLTGKTPPFQGGEAYNSTGNFKPSPQNVITKFKNILEQSGVNVTQRYSFGSDIKAACGQLATKITS